MPNFVGLFFERGKWRSFQVLDHWVSPVADELDVIGLGAEFKTQAVHCIKHDLIFKRQDGRGWGFELHQTTYRLSVAFVTEIAFLHEGFVKRNTVLYQPVAIAKKTVATGGPIRRSIDKTDSLMTAGYEVANRIDGTCIHVAANAMEFFIDRFAYKVDNGNARVDKLTDVRSVGSFPGYGDDQAVYAVTLHGEQQLFFTLEAFMALANEYLVAMVVCKFLKTFYGRHVEMVEHVGNDNPKRERPLLFKSDRSLIGNVMKLFR